MALPWWQHHKHCRAYYYYYYYLQSCKLLPPPAPPFNPFIVILKPQNNGPSYSNTVIGIHWPLMGGLLHWYSEEGTGRSFFLNMRPSPRYPTRSVHCVIKECDCVSWNDSICRLNLLTGFLMQLLSLNYCMLHRHGLVTSLLNSVMLIVSTWVRSC